MKVTIRFALAVCAAAALARGASGADEVRPGRLELYATWTAAGLEVSYTGDDNANCRAEFVWRRRGEEKWRNGVDMTHDRKRRLIWASIWPLEQGVGIEARVTLSDPDAPAGSKPAELTASATTKRMVLEPAGGRAYYVSPKGSDAAAGTKDSPFRTLAHASKRLKAGDVLFAVSGVYREGNLFRGLKGAPGRPIVIMAAPGEKPVIDASTEITKGSGAWKKHDGEVYVAAVKLPPSYAGYVAQDGVRMFRYRSLKDLKAAPLGPRRAWYADRDAGKLYVRTGDGGDPNGHVYNAGKHSYGVWLEGCEDVVLRGFEIRYGGDACVRVSGGSRGCIVIDNVIHNSAWGIFMKDTATRENAFWRNTIYERGLSDWAWGAIKKSGYPRQGIAGTGGRGTSACYNRVYGWFDLIVLSSWQKVERIELNRDCDIMFNDLHDAGDDALEPDGCGVNYRIHGNRIRNCWTAISLAPVERGPVYVTRNTATFKTLMFKYNVGNSVSLGWAYCYHNSGYCLLRDGTGTAVRFAPNIPCSNKVMKNNAFVSAEWSIGNWRRGYEFDHNCYFNVPSKGIRRFNCTDMTCDTIEIFRQKKGQEKHGIYADPRFRSPVGLGLAMPKDFKATFGADMNHTKEVLAVEFALAPGSPCVDAGAVIRGINDDFKGRGPDIGSIEVGAEPLEFTTGPGGGPGTRPAPAAAAAEAASPAAAVTPETPKGPTPAEKAAAGKAFEQLKAEIVKGASAGRRARVYVDMAGTPTRSRVTAADSDGVAVSARGLEVKVKWSALSPVRFYGMARKYSRDHEALAAYCRGNGLAEEAEREAAAAK